MAYNKKNVLEVLEPIGATTFRANPKAQTDDLP